MPTAHVLPEGTMQINISLTLPPTQSVWAIQVSSDLSKRFSHEFVLGSDSNHPHITLCSMSFLAESMGAVFGAVKSVAARHQNILCTPDPGPMKARQRYIGVHVDKTDEIFGLHTNMLETLAPLRNIVVREGDHYKMDLSEKQIEYIGEYGYPDAFELYEPHFTIIRLKNLSEVHQAATNWQGSPFESQSIGVYLSGDHGTCLKMLMETRLGPE